MLMRAICVLMAFLLFFSAGLQYNDPDPVAWFAIYGTAGFLTAVAAIVPGRYPWPLPAIVGVWAVVWAATLVPDLIGRVKPSEMFASWEMKDFVVEAEREAFGLLVTGAWMGVLTFARLLHRRPATPAAP